MRIALLEDEQDQADLVCAWLTAAGIVVLLTLEAAAVILLFGGEVIAQIDRARVGRARARQRR